MNMNDAIQMCRTSDTKYLPEALLQAEIYCNIGFPFMYIRGYKNLTAIINKIVDKYGDWK